MIEAIMRYSRKENVLALAAFLSVLALFGLLENIVPHAYLGWIGFWPMAIFAGFHGGTTLWADTIGYVVFVLANTAFYYLVLSWLTRHWQKRKSRKIPASD
jgi:hypothetical protein